MDERKYLDSLSKKEYMKGRGKETEYYIITAMYGINDYKLTLIRNNTVIFEESYNGLTNAKYGAFEWLLSYDPSIFNRNAVTMVHYKENRKSNRGPWVKDTSIELNRNLEKFLETQEQWNNNVLREDRGIPLPSPVSRNREYSSYREEKRNEVVYEYLFNGNTHRWIDEHTLELDPVWSRGYQAMGILHHLGLKNAFKGLFKGLSVAEAIDLIEQECDDHPADRNLYAPIISSLSGIKNNEPQDEDTISNFQADEGKEYPEGKIAFVLHKKRERNPKLIKEAKQFFIRKHGRLFCEACNFDFKTVYGDRGDDYIEGHHKKLVSDLKEGEMTKIEDIAMLCSNCHRMIHRKPLISVEELAEIVNSKNE
ncbi:HNH endonuclease [Paenibacillus lautus]|uniref:HNH endonuclease n=1 Tax=Paenibacillus lautus TaxID=1401 RepID=UPI003D27AB1A